jgi:hypothetical protein
LEQPAHSGLWADMGLPMPNQPAREGCFTLYVEQAWFGYVTRKPTWLLVCGVPKHQLPPMPFRLLEYPVRLPGGADAYSRLSSAARARTIKPFAEWLCQVARLAHAHAHDTYRDRRRAWENRPSSLASLDGQKHDNRQRAGMMGENCP